MGALEDAVEIVFCGLCRFARFIGAVDLFFDAKLRFRCWRISERLGEIYLVRDKVEWTLIYFVWWYYNLIHFSD